MSATKQNSNAIGGSPYQVPPEPNRWPSIGLAVGVHALLLAFLVVGINWTNNQPVAVEAEVWDTSVQQAAPPAPPQPEPEPQPEPQPETPPPTPRVAEPPPVAEPAPPKQPDIALDREKKRKEELKRKEEEKAERERELAQQKREEEKKEKALAEKKAREEEKKKAEELARKEEEAEKKKLAEKEKLAKEKADKAAKAKAEKAEAAKLDKLRNEEMKRLMSGAGNPGSTGSAEKSTAPRIDKGYIASIAAKIKGNTSYPGSTDVPGNPEVVFQVEQLPTGEILSVRKTKSSGIPAFDEAVERGINKSSPLPKKKDGTVERSVQVGFKLKEMN
ncbi:cell envelope integrity protein TolA [Massilia sp. 2TAF26]|uniref:cell envelope integrity protein TolA n=1 Tax=Massilia sp. 2TAF26 TaxID=3233012 RepID=UPI003F95C8DA